MLVSVYELKRNKKFQKLTVAVATLDNSAETGVNMESTERKSPCSLRGAHFEQIIPTNAKSAAYVMPLKEYAP